MPSNIIIFEAEYISELVSSMNSACELMSEAVQSLKQASLHEGWKCKECARISSELDDLNIRLGRLDEGVNETARLLGGSVSRFTSLEASYKSQAKELSDDLTQNHGYPGEVHTGPSGTQAGNQNQAQNQNQSQNNSSASSTNSGSGSSGAGASSSAASGAASAATAAASKASGGKSYGKSASSGKAEASSSAASTTAPASSGGTGVIISGNGKAASETSSSSATTTTSSSFIGAGVGYSSSSVNLPVTHIPDMPNDTASGTKYTQEIANTAVSRVADTITGALSSNPGSAGASMSAQVLVEAYNAGKSIVENSASIMSNPSMPHTKERLAMAEGIANLAGASLFTMSGSTSGSHSSMNMNAGLRENFRSNAGNLISAVQNVQGGSELKSVLSSIMSESSDGISPFTMQANSGGGESFFDKVLEALKKSFLGGNESSSLKASSNSPVDEFMKNLITEQV